jgi:DNA-3-methyladenine glycosylase
MKKILKSRFFNRSTLKIAPKLLGKFLVRKRGQKTIALMITDVEAYIGHQDGASHASRGRTDRNAPMFGEAGCWYVYFTYGMHWMLNVVTEKKEYPAAILIRGAGDIGGPARLTKFLKIDGKLNGKSASRRSGLWIEDRGAHILSRRVKKGTRIGVDYAGKWKDKLWRFYLL